MSVLDPAACVATIEPILGPVPQSHLGCRNLLLDRIFPGLMLCLGLFFLLDFPRLESGAPRPIIVVFYLVCELRGVR
jgi:hypothetical protein